MSGIEERCGTHSCVCLSVCLSAMFIVLSLSCLHQTSENYHGNLLGASTQHELA